MTWVGKFVLDHTAKHADDTGSSEELGVRGLVWRAAEHVDPETGELRDVLLVATRRHGRIGFADLPAADVADSWPCGRIDAGGYLAVCQRAIARAGKSGPDPRVVEVLAIATGIKHSTAHPNIGAAAKPEQSVFGSDDERAAHDQATGGQGLLRRMADSTNAHTERNRAP